MSSSRWQELAACRGMDPELFFPQPGHGAAEAKAACATCPVKAECYEAGREEFYGVWGGTTRKERQMAEKGHIDGRLPMRGCWLCGMPADRPNRYCSDECRHRARLAAQRRYHQNRRWEAS